MQGRVRIKMQNGDTFILNNRKQRKKNNLAERFALKVFTENEPYHYIVAKSASIETIVKAMECALSVGEAKKQERK